MRSKTTKYLQCFYTNKGNMTFGTWSCNWNKKEKKQNKKINTHNNTSMALNHKNEIHIYIKKSLKTWLILEIHSKFSTSDA